MSHVHAKTYSLIRNLFGDNGENPSVLSVATILDPSPFYPEQGRIIVGTPTAAPGDYHPEIAAFNCGAEAAMQLADVIQQAVADVDVVEDAECPPVTIATGTERAARWPTRADRLVSLEGSPSDVVDSVLAGRDARMAPARCEVCCRQIKEGERIQQFHIMVPISWDENGEVDGAVQGSAFVHADPCHEWELVLPDEHGSHLVDGEFQSDKYPTTPRGCVPLKCTDVTAQDLLWEYAERRRPVDDRFSSDLQAALRLKGYEPPAHPVRWIPTPIPALWFDRDGCGPDHMFLQLQPFPAVSADGHSLPASLGLRVNQGGIVLLGRSMVGGGFNLHLDQVDELWRQLGAYRQRVPVATRRFFRATDGGCHYDVVAADLEHAQRILDEDQAEFHGEDDTTLTAAEATARGVLTWTELTPEKAATVITTDPERGHRRPLRHCDFGEWFSSAP